MGFWKWFGEDGGWKWVAGVTAAGGTIVAGGYALLRDGTETVRFGEPTPIVMDSAKDPTREDTVGLIGRRDENGGTVVDVLPEKHDTELGEPGSKGTPERLSDWTEDTEFFIELPEGWTRERIGNYRLPFMYVVDSDLMAKGDERVLDEGFSPERIDRIRVVRSVIDGLLSQPRTVTMKNSHGVTEAVCRPSLAEMSSSAEDVGWVYEGTVWRKVFREAFDSKIREFNYNYEMHEIWRLPFSYIETAINRKRASPGDIAYAIDTMRKYVQMGLDGFVADRIRLISMNLGKGDEKDAKDWFDSTATFIRGDLYGPYDEGMGRYITMGMMETSIQRLEESFPDWARKNSAKYLDEWTGTFRR